jgi:hypothetical protein
MGEEPEKEPEEALDRMSEDTRLLTEGIKNEVKEDVEKAKGGQWRRLATTWRLVPKIA